MGADYGHQNATDALFSSKDMEVEIELGGNGKWYKTCDLYFKLHLLSTRNLKHYCGITLLLSVETDPNKNLN